MTSICYFKPSITHIGFPRFLSHRFHTRAFSPGHRFRICLVNRPLRFYCRCDSGSATAIDMVEKEEQESTTRRNVSVRVLLDHQVKFGEHVALLGSSKELGSWKKRVPMEWTEAGWVCELDLRERHTVEFKFVVITKGEEGMIWEEGDNRVLPVPESGVYDIVCRWNKMKEGVALSAVEREEFLEGEEDGDGFRIEDGGLAVG
ncbi:hypothetical protein HPP92_009960 [Vanilla planifolia]|uniref:CBM20 domain-containing protein n=1 Tax=Vanilla planifolia TaxID=51239 RepID=A0A835RB27_VANPL|nr:hypothetical protein HPP92_009960 [Vanilla planifolia]